MSSELATARRKTLQAMGLTLYTARYPLPGAAASPDLLEACAAAEVESGVPPSMPDRLSEEKSFPEAMAQMVSSTALPTEPPGQRPTPGRAPVAASPAPAPFTLAAVALGGCLWLEELPDGVLGRDQVKLMRAICQAMSWPVEPVSVNQFAWPMHRNPQFDQGAHAARAALSAFVQRQIEASHCARLILLGQPVQDRLGELSPQTPVLRTQSTRDMLREPLLKRDAWRDLRRG